MIDIKIYVTQLINHPTTWLLCLRKRKKEKNLEKYVQKVTGAVPDCKLSIYFLQNLYLGVGEGSSKCWLSYFWFVSFHLLHSFYPL